MKAAPPSISICRAPTGTAFFQCVVTVLVLLCTGIPMAASGQSMADLSLILRTDTPRPAVGQVVTITVTVSNAGPVDATGLVIRDVIPAGIEYVAARPSRGGFDPVTGFWSVGQLEADAAETLKLDLRILIPHMVENIAQVNAVDQLDPDSTPANGAPGEDDQDNVILTARTDVPVISVESTDLDFGQVTSAGPVNRSLVISNHGASTLDITDLHLNGPHAGDFAVVSPSAPFSVLAGASVTVNIRFAPEEYGPREAELQIISTDPEGSTVVVELLGEYLGTGSPRISVAPGTLDFGMVDVGSSRTLTLTVSNDGDTLLDVTDVHVSGPGAASFVVEGETVFAVEPGNGRFFAVRFNAVTRGPREALLVVQSSDPGKPAVEVALRGGGEPAVGPDLVPEPERLTFGSTNIGESMVLEISLRNHGDDELVVTGIDFGGTHSEDFSWDDPAFDLFISPGDSEELRIRFTPLAPGTRSAELLVTSNDADTGVTSVSVDGEGTGEGSGLPARVQFVHAVADPLASVVDVYRDGALWLDDFGFGEATPRVMTASGPAVFALAPASSRTVSDAWTSFSVDLPADRRVTITSTGLLEPRAFAPNPDGIDTFVRLLVHVASPNESAAEGGVLLVQATTDIGIADIITRDAGEDRVLADGLAYGDIQSDDGLMDRPARIDVTASADRSILIESFDATGMTQPPDAGLFLIAGFLNPESRLGGAPLTLLHILDNGSVDRLPVTARSRVQFIQNIPDPGVPRVDLYLGDMLELDDWGYRSATGYVEVPAGETIISVTGESASGPDQALARRTVPFEADRSYGVIVQGLAEPRGFERNPDGRQLEIGIVVQSEARETALSEGFVDFYAVHGATDVGTVDLLIPGFGTFVDGIRYGDVSDYASIPSGTRGFSLTNSSISDVVVDEFSVDFLRREGRSAALVLSGFLTPEDDQAGESLDLLAVFSDGSVRSSALITSREAAPTYADDVQLGVYPNPARSAANLAISLPAAGHVTVELVDLLGRRAAGLVDRTFDAGVHAQAIDTSGLAPGLYMIVARHDGRQHVRPLMVVR